MQTSIDKQKLIALLERHASNDFAKSTLAEYISEKAFEAGHLYTDMGLKSRIELNKLMSENYPALSASRPADKRWKKFLFST